MIFAPERMPTACVHQPLIIFTPYSKLQYLHEFSNIWFQKSTDIRATKEVCQRFFENSKKLLVFEFWWVVLIFDYAPTSSLRGPATQHLNPRPKAEFDGTGWTGWTDGLEKCHLYLHLPIYSIGTSKTFETRPSASGLDAKLLDPGGNL